MLQHALKKLGSRALQAAGIASALAIAATGAAQAASTSKIGWVWNSQLAVASYTPSSSYSYNSAGGSITISHLATGFYLVQFGKLSDGTQSDVQVSPYSGSGYCTSDTWSFTTKGKVVNAYVTCFNASGAAADSYFTLLYQAHSGTFGNSAKGLAFLWANQSTAASYTPSTFYQYNSTGGTNTIARTGTGSYTVTLPGLTKTGGDVQVTAYGGSAARCKVSHWTNNTNATFVYVLCFNGAGQLADEEYNLAYSLKESFGHTPSATARGVYAWANNATKTTDYGTYHVFQYNGFSTGYLTSRKTGTGSYTVTIPGSLGYAMSNVLVTAYDPSSNVYCNVGGWGSTIIDVYCYAQGGGLVDSRFDVALQTTD